MSKRVMLILLCVLAMLAAACGGGRDDADGDNTNTGNSTAETTAETTGSSTDDTTSDTTPTTEDTGGGLDCDAETPEATEIGVSADTITVVVMADVDSPLAPGLFEGSKLGVEAWGEHVNAEGGLACRQVEVVFADTKLDANETVNGFLRGCDEALALVGTTVLFSFNVTDMENCTDMAGNAIGIPDIGYISTEPGHQCSPNAFNVSRPGSSCPWTPNAGEDRELVGQIGPVQHLLDEGNGPFNGIFLVPGDLPSTVWSSAGLINAHQEIGVTWADQFGVGGTMAQAEFGRFVQAISDGGLNYVYNGSNDATMIKMLAEASAQGLDLDSVTWMCSLSCYTDAFRQASEAEGVYLWFQFLPFNETDQNEELADFMDAINDPFPQAWAAGAWADGVLFERVVNSIVERDGVNGLTRQAVLDELNTIDDFDVNEWWTPMDLTTPVATSDCFVLMQVQNEEFVRVHPAEPGELACTDAVLTTSDPSTITPS